MEIGHHAATEEDLGHIVAMYPDAEAEQTALREAWGIADGIAAPQLETLRDMLADQEANVVVGKIDDVVLGFAAATIEELLPQAGGERIGMIRWIYVAEDARMVGIGEAMLKGLMEWFGSRGVSRFDAVVSPGHRLAKNFFESAGFKARRITMYRHDG
jgi:L-amino acid N-acyltransferase YncA